MLTKGTVVFAINTTNSPKLDWFYLSFSYNTTTLHALNVSFASGILGTGVNVGEECIDNAPKLGTSCQPFDGPGVVTLFLVASPSPTESGPLFKTTFNVTGSGFSQVHIFRALLHSSLLGDLSVATQDGYFTNITCSKNGPILCKPPEAGFITIPTPVLSTNVLSTFDASSTLSQNTGANITRYSWNWGDNSQTITQLPLTRHLYNAAGKFQVTLTVTDTFGISWTIAQPVQVVNLVINVAIRSLVVSSTRTTPGAVIQMTTMVQNNSTIPENVTVQISVDSQIISSGQFNSLALLGGTASLLTTLNTTGLSLGQHTIQASVVRVSVGNNTLNDSMNRTIELVPPPDFQVATSPPSIALYPGSQGNVTITLVSFYGFTGTATLAANSTINLAASFTRNPLLLAPGASILSTLNIGASSSLRPGTYTLVVMAYVGPVSRSVSIPVRIEAAPSLPSSALTIFGMSPVEFWAITGGILTGVIFSGALAYRRRKRSFYL